MRTRGKQVLLAMVASAVVLVMAGVLTWRGVATSRRDHVTIIQGGGHDGVAITCAGSTPRMRRFDGIDRVPVMQARPGMECRMPVVVTNESSGTVRLEAIVMPYMGPSAGTQVQVEELEGLPPARRLSHGGLDAAFRLDRDLGPGDSYRVTVPFTYREEGCNDGTLGFTGFPRIRVTSLGLTGVVKGGSVAFRSDGRAPGCTD